MNRYTSDAIVSLLPAADLAAGVESTDICPVRHASPDGLATLSHILGRKWTTSIITTLDPSPIRHGALSRKLSGIARKVLHQSLDGLIADGLVEKVIGLDDMDGPSVAYGLTTLGHSLAPVIVAMHDWCDLHLDELLASQAEGGPRIRVSHPT